MRQVQSPLTAAKVGIRGFPAGRLLLALAISLIPAFGYGKLTSLGLPPPWPQLEKFQEILTAGQFRYLLNEVYAPGNTFEPWIRIEDDQARIRTKTEEEGGEFILRFRASGQRSAIPPRYWRALGELPGGEEGKPLSGIRIALDPGHIGGSYGPLEERSFSFGNGPPIQEGDLTLKVALHLQQRLAALGASVRLIRSAAKPITNETVESMMPVAYKRLSEETRRQGKFSAGKQSQDIRRLSELLFYRVSEIRARAEKVNKHIKPDLVLALHFNAATWFHRGNGQFPSENHFHVLVNGAYSGEELSNDDIRFEMLKKLLSGAAEEEIALGKALARSMAAANGLPPFFYTTPNAVKIGKNPYLWARNLLANRLYECPVVYLEPYVLNSREVAERVRGGDFEGYREVAGALRKSLVREYADGVVAGLLDYYGQRSSISAEEPGSAFSDN